MGSFWIRYQLIVYSFSITAVFKVHLYDLSFIIILTIFSSPQIAETLGWWTETSWSSGAAAWRTVRRPPLGMTAGSPSGTAASWTALPLGATNGTRRTVAGGTAPEAAGAELWQARPGRMFRQVREASGLEGRRGGRAAQAAGPVRRNWAASTVGPVHNGIARLATYCIVSPTSPTMRSLVVSDIPISLIYSHYASV